MSNLAEAVVRKMVSELLKAGSTRAFVGEMVRVAVDPEFPLQYSDFSIPAYTVSPGQARADRMNRYARTETVTVIVTAFAGPAATEDELVYGGPGVVGLGQMIEAADVLFDNSHEDGAVMDEYFRVEKVSEGPVVLIDAGNSAGLSGYRQITFEVEDYQAR